MRHTLITQFLSLLFPETVSKLNLVRAAATVDVSACKRYPSRTAAVVHIDSLGVDQITPNRICGPSFVNESNGRFYWRLGLRSRRAAQMEA